MCVPGCPPLQLPRDNQPEPTRLPCGTCTSLEVSVGESQPGSIEQDGYQEPWLMLWPTSGEQT